MKTNSNSLNLISLTIIFIFSSLLFSSCKTYIIPKDSFVNQFNGIDSSQLKNVTVLGPVGIPSKYKANPISIIKCIDANGNEVKLNNSPSIETRFTINNKKKMIFYFDRLMIKDSVVYGFQSRFLGIKNSIPLKDITKIEVQDGHKKFRYLITENTP